MNEQKIAPVLSEDALKAMWDALRSYHGGEPMKLGHLEFARAIEQAVLARVGAVREQALEQAAQIVEDVGNVTRYVIADAIRALKGTPAAAVAVAQPACLENAWRAGWAACRDAEYVGEEAENDAWHSSQTFRRASDIADAAPQPSPNPGPLAAVERQAIVALLDLAYAAYIAAEDSVEDDNPDFIHVDKKASETLNDALDTVEALPDDCPGYALGGSAPAKWALRRLFGCTTMAELDAAIAASKEGASQ